MEGITRFVVIICVLQSVYSGSGSIIRETNESSESNNVANQCDFINEISNLVQNKSFENAKLKMENLYAEIVKKSMESNFENTLKFITENFDGKIYCQLLQILDQHAEKNEWDKILLDYTILESNCSITQQRFNKSDNLLSGKNFCIRNVKAENEFLYPTANKYQTSTAKSKPKVPGKVFTGFRRSFSPDWNNWTLIPQFGTDNTYKIYNEAVGGFLNVENVLSDKVGRDVFIGTDKSDVWLFKTNSSSNTITIQNQRTSEFLYVVNDRHAKKLTYPGEAGRFTYTRSLSENELDEAAQWIIANDCQPIESDVEEFLEFEGLCFESKYAESEYLYFSRSVYPKFLHEILPNVTGRLFAGYRSIASDWMSWSLIPHPDYEDGFKIYNRGFGGFMNAVYKLTDPDHRDIFGEVTDDADAWRFHKKAGDDEFLLENVKTGEYLSVISNQDEELINSLEKPGKITFTVNYNQSNGDDEELTWKVHKKCLTSKVHELEKYLNSNDLCFVNVREDEVLYPTRNLHQKYQDYNLDFESGRVLTAFMSSSSSLKNSWSLIPVSLESNTFLIYNNEYGGYMNAMSYRIKDHERRDVFVETDGRQDIWKIEKQGYDSYSLENVATGEHLYAIMSRNDGELMYSSETGRTTYTWNYKGEPIDNSGLWKITNSC